MGWRLRKNPLWRLWQNPLWRLWQNPLWRLWQNPLWRLRQDPLWRLRQNPLRRLPPRNNQLRKWKQLRKTRLNQNPPIIGCLLPRKFVIGSAALPPPMKTKEKVEQGKGTADHLMPLGYLFFFVMF